MKTNADKQRRGLAFVVQWCSAQRWETPKLSTCNYTDGIALDTSITTHDPVFLVCGRRLKKKGLNWLRPSQSRPSCVVVFSTLQSCQPGSNKFGCLQHFGACGVGHARTNRLPDNKQLKQLERVLPETGMSPPDVRVKSGLLFMYTIFSYSEYSFHFFFLVMGQNTFVLKQHDQQT